MAFHVFINPKLIPKLIAERKEDFVRTILELQKDRTRDGLNK